MIKLIINESAADKDLYDDLYSYADEYRMTSRWTKDNVEKYLKRQKNFRRISDADFDKVVAKVNKDFKRKKKVKSDPYSEASYKTESAKRRFGKKSCVTESAIYDLKEITGYDAEEIFRDDYYEDLEELWNNAEDMDDFIYDCFSEWLDEDFIYDFLANRVGINSKGLKDKIHKIYIYWRGDDVNESYKRLHEQDVEIDDLALTRREDNYVSELADLTKYGTSIIALEDEIYKDCADQPERAWKLIKALHAKLKNNQFESVEIGVKHEGILEVPDGKNVDDLPFSHFEKLAKKKGLGKINKALNNLQVWNKKKDPKLSKWAGNMIDKLNNKLKKESYSPFDDYIGDDDNFDYDVGITMTILCDGKNLYGVKNFSPSNQYDDYVSISTGDFDKPYADDEFKSNLFSCCYEAIEPLLIKLSKDVEKGVYEHKYMQFIVSATTNAYIEGYEPVTYSKNYGYQPEEPGVLDFDYENIITSMDSATEITEDEFFEDVEVYDLKPLVNSLTNENWYERIPTGYKWRNIVIPSDDDFEAEIEEYIADLKLADDKIEWDTDYHGGMFGDDRVISLYSSGEDYTDVKYKVEDLRDRYLYDNA